MIILFLVTNAILAAVICSNPKTECVEPGGTRYFDTVPVTLDCWKYKVIYACKSDANNNCQQLKDQGCSPGTVTCKEMWGGRCAVQEVIYDCPSIICDGYEVICNDAGGYCLTGDCVSHERSKDSDMAKTLAALTAAAEASKQFDSNRMAVFTGYEARCSCDSLGFIDCCADSGWGQDLNLAKCDDEDRKLARSRAEGLAAFVGEYTIDHVLWKQRKKTYCVFGSKLARIVQVAGRAQLGISFGDPQGPNCRGLTPEELQRIDFSKIDFSEVFKEIQNKINIESMMNVNTRIQQKVDSFKQDPNKMLKNKQYVK